MSGLLGAAEVAELLGVRQRSVYWLANHHADFPAPAVAGPPRLYRRSDVEHWTAAHPKGQRTVAACGHPGPEVNSAGRCFGCHLQDLRDNGQRARADRLARLRELQEEGQLTWSRLWTSLAASWEEGSEYVAEAMVAEEGWPGHGR